MVCFLKGQSIFDTWKNPSLDRKGSQADNIAYVLNQKSPETKTVIFFYLNMTAIPQSTCNHNKHILKIHTRFLYRKWKWIRKSITNINLCIYHEKHICGNKFITSAIQSYAATPLAIRDHTNFVWKSSWMAETLISA